MKWLHGLLFMMLVMVSSHSSFALTANYKVSPAFIESLNALSTGFYGLSAYGRLDATSMQTELSKNSRQIDALESLCMSDAKQLPTMQAYIIKGIDDFASEYAPGTTIPDDILTRKKILWGYYPGYGCTIRAVILIDLAKKRKSMDDIKRVIQSIYRAEQASSNWGEQMSLRQNLESKEQILKEKTDYGGVGTTLGAELAWLCEQLMVDLNKNDDSRIPLPAKSVLKDYCNWRKETVAQGAMTEDMCLPIYLEFKTIEYAKRFADKLPPESLAASK